MLGRNPEHTHTRINSKEMDISYMGITEKFNVEFLLCSRLFEQQLRYLGYRSCREVRAAALHISVTKQ